MSAQGLTPLAKSHEVKHFAGFRVDQTCSIGFLDLAVSFYCVRGLALFRIFPDRAKAQ
jgi:hypothetical protein